MTAGFDEYATDAHITQNAAGHLIARRDQRYSRLRQKTWMADLLPVDSDSGELAREGHVMEMLSEHTLEGYLLTGRHGIFSTYEAFDHVIDSMFNQHAKWLDTSHVPWRAPISSRNLLITSTVWRQDHNDFTHQDPRFPDLGAATRHCARGTRSWEWASTDRVSEPDVVMAIGGDFDALFTTSKPIIYNFHGYHWLIHRLSYRRIDHDNLHVRGYKEKGIINTPLELAIHNQVDRFRLAIDVIDRVPRLQSAGASIKEQLRNMQISCINHAHEHGADRAEDRDWKWPW